MPKLVPRARTCLRCAPPLALPLVQAAAPGRAAPRSAPATTVDDRMAFRPAGHRAPLDHGEIHEVRAEP